jgi:para-nitrobenzyl esterase
MRKKLLLGMVIVTSLIMSACNDSSNSQTTTTSSETTMADTVMETTTEASKSAEEHNVPTVGEATVGVIAEIENGKVLGRREDGIYIFKGIPYGRAERWEKPVKPQAWEGLLNANYVGPVCPQVGGSGEYLSNPAYYLIDSSEENFLNLNVWSTGLEAEKPKPVIFFIHGGGYSNGSSMELQQYDGKNLSEYGDVVFVSVNHRINYLGYLDFSAYGEEYQYSGNIGHADLIMALEWVRDNIEVFGGDSGNVTLVGQSGGSRKVAQLMAMPSAEGLFHKAVAMSSFITTFPHTSEDGQAETAKLVEYLGLSGESNEDIMTTLKEMPYNELAAACKEAGVSIFYGICDDDYVTGDISASAHIPLITGTVLAEHNGSLTKVGVAGSYRNNSVFRDEQAYYDNIRTNLTDDDIRTRYEALYGGRAQEVMEAFQKAYPGKDLFEGLFFDNRYRVANSIEDMTANENAAAFTGWGGTIYEYIGTYTLPLFGGAPAWHTGGDIAFIFRNLDSIHSWIAGDEEGAEQYSQAMATALINFARTGAPSQDGLEWPAFTIENGETMIFDTTSEVRNYPDKEFLELLDEINKSK